MYISRSSASAALALVLAVTDARGQDVVPHLGIRVEIVSSHKEARLDFDGLRTRLDTMIKNQVSSRYKFIAWEKRRFQDTLVLVIEDTAETSGNHYLHARIGSREH